MNSKRKKDQSKARAKPQPTFDLISYNVSLDVTGLGIEDLHKILGQNPNHLRVVGTQKTVEVTTDDIFTTATVAGIPGIPEKELEELREVGLYAYSSANAFFYRGRHVIAYFWGNLKALVRLEELIRNGGKDGSEESVGVPIQQ